MFSGECQEGLLKMPNGVTSFLCSLEFTETPDNLESYDHCTISMSQGPRIFYVDSEGTRTEGMRFAVGSGSTYAFGVLDNE